MANDLLADERTDTEGRLHPAQCDPVFLRHAGAAAYNVDMRLVIHIRNLMPALLLVALSTGATTPDESSFVVAWNDYTDSLNKLELQTGCKPRHYRPPAGSPVRGAVLLIHGFSACPQQYFQLGPAIAAAGYEVLVPLLPGHGRLPGNDGRDNLSALPAGGDWDRYGKFAARMNSIMAQAPGEHVVVGYSLGGGIALNAILRNPELYDRTLLLAPLLAIRGGRMIEHIVEFFGDVPLLKDLRVKTRGLRAKCRRWSEASRAGFCDYRYKHAAALVRLEEQNHDWIVRTRLTRPIQLILARGDHTISNRAIYEFSLEQMEHGPIALCSLPEDVPHEILTPYENTGRKMYWLGQLLDITLKFTIDGKLTGQVTNTEDPVAHCLRQPGEVIQSSGAELSFSKLASAWGKK